MENSKLIDALRQLSTRERSKYRELVYSPYFNKNKKVRALVDCCLQHAPEFENGALAKQRLFHKVFDPSEPYEELRLNNVISDALRLLYLFLGQQRIMAHEHRWRPYQMEALLSRHLAKHLPATERRLQRLTTQDKLRSHAHFYDRHRTETLIDRSTLLQKGREYSSHLQEASNALDRFYWCSKLRIACDMASRNRVINAAYECHLLDELRRIYQNQPSVLADQPTIQLYYQALEMITTEEEINYRTFRQLLGQHGTLLSIEEQYDLYDYAQNYCVKQINSGNPDYYANILDLYKSMIEQDLLLRDGYLTQWSYINIITAGLRLRDFKWTEWFIYAHKEQLTPKARENVFTYSLAALYFEQSDYHRALQTLQGVTFSDVFYHLSAKIIQLKSYYELEEHEAFLSLWEASRKLLRRNRQLSTYQIKSNQQFLKLARRLHQLAMKAPTLTSSQLASTTQQLGQLLDEEQSIANRSWLKGKLEEYGDGS